MYKFIYIQYLVQNIFYVTYHLIKNCMCCMLFQYSGDGYYCVYIFIYYLLIILLTTWILTALVLYVLFSIIFNVCSCYKNLWDFLFIKGLNNFTNFYMCLCESMRWKLIEIMCIYIGEAYEEVTWRKDYSRWNFI